MKTITFTLRDLEGRPGLTEAQFVRSKAAAIRVIRSGAVATAAGDHGAINIWRDRRSRLHAAFCRHLVYLDHSKLATLDDLELWLKKWWPALKDGTIA